MTTLTTAVASATTPASAAAYTTAEAQTTAVTACHLHATDVFCMDGHGDEVSVSLTGTPTGELPAQYTDCHSHGSETFCVDPNGNDVAVVETSGSAHDHSDGESSEGGLDCHFHAGVE